jgi:hypothetical protein
MITLDTVDLPSDLRWTDEFDWNAVEQTAVRTLTGSLVVSSAARVGGRPVTLQAEDESSAWATAATVAALRNLTVIPGRTMTLTLQGVARTVIFRHHDGAALEATPIVYYRDGADWYAVTLRLMEV